MTISNIRITLNDGRTNCKARVSIVLDNCIAIHQIQIINGKKGMFVAFPEWKDKEKGFVNLIHPINTWTRKYIEIEILNAYYKMIEDIACSCFQEQPIKEMQMKKEVDILGTKYKIVIEELENADGECNQLNKVIRVRKDTINRTHFNQIMRHEIIHAYQFESGLAFNFEHKSIGVDETQIDWFAIQSPKIYKTFRELKIM